MVNSTHVFLNLPKIKALISSPDLYDQIYSKICATFKREKFCFMKEPFNNEECLNVIAELLDEYQLSHSASKSEIAYIQSCSSLSQVILDDIFKESFFSNKKNNSEN
jgi:hypothetical protein